MDTDTQPTGVATAPQPAAALESSATAPTGSGGSTGLSEAPATPDGANQPDAAWYVVHTYSGYENKVRTNLKRRIASMDMKDRIFDVIVPVEDEVEVKDGQRRTVQRKLYPGYVLVHMKMDHESWYVVRNTPGVTGFVGSKDEPVPLPQHEVDAILKQMKAEAPKVRISFQPNDRVRVIDGPFTDFVGVVDQVNHEKGKVTVLVSFFGRETPLELDFLQIEKT